MEKDVFALLAGLAQNLALTTTLDLARAADLVVSTVRSLFGVRRAVLYQLDPPSGSLTSIAASGEGAGQWVGQTLPAGMGLAGRAVTNARLISSLDVLAEPDLALPSWLRERALEDGLRSLVATPLAARGERYGVLVLADTLGRAFTGEERQLLAAVADQAAVALQTARLLAESEARRRAAESLASVARSVSQALDPDEVGQRITESVCALLGTQHAALCRIEPDSEDLVTLAFSGDAGPAVGRHLVLPRGTGVCGFAARERRLAVTPNLLADPRFTFPAEVRARIEQAAYRAVLAAPLVVQDRVVGVLSTGDREGRAFSEAEVDLFQVFAAQAAVALENARLYAEATRRRHEAEALIGMMRTPAESLSISTVGARTVASVLDLLNAQSATLRVLQPGGSLRQVASAGSASISFGPGHVLAPGTGLCGRAVSEGRPVRSRDVQRDPGLVPDEELKTHYQTSSLRGALAVPLQLRGTITGALVVADQTARDFSEAEVSLLQAFADHAALAIANARLYEEAEERRREAEVLAELARQVQTALRASEARYRMIVETTDEIIYRVAGTLQDPRGGRVEFVSGQARSIVGYAPDEFLRDPGLWASIVHPDDWPAVMAATRGIFATRRAATRTYRVRHKATGEYRWLEDRVSPETDEGGRVVAIQGAARDVTDRLRDEVERRRLFEDAGAAREQLQALSHHLVEMQEAERRHLARELHDEIGQLLTGLKLSLEIVRTAPADRAGASLEEAEHLLEHLIGRVRDLSLDLRPAMLDDLGLLPALLWHVERYRALTGIRVHFEHAGLDRRFPSEVETAAYRIVQEALTNVARHSGVHEATLSIGVTDEILELEILDHGKGFEPGPVLTGRRSSGLAGMRERAALLGGQLGVESAPGAGTRVTADLPLRSSGQRDRLDGDQPSG